MRFTTYEHEGVERAGVVRGEVIHPLPAGTTVLGLIEEESLTEAGRQAPVPGHRRRGRGPAGRGRIPRPGDDGHPQR
ncbi:hypothetical protein [Streptomyces adelaidensis]|uniref:hypothetical protein n=1 Tax=Streptomyces adelaidensis TaxID=2796465 RepID=UPI001F43A6D6|nr:hypothetical protein [Streptomyces adelaidensis]